jgi:hypothetical protein
MSDEMQQPLSAPQPGNPSITPGVIASQPKRSNNGLWVFISVAVGLICCCMFICMATIAVGVGYFAAEKAGVESVLDSFMKNMAARDAESAYALFSPRAQRQFSISKIQQELDDNNFVLFDGYQGLFVLTININPAANSDPDKPQGIVADVTGIITYKSGVQGDFNATLEKVNNKWKIYGMNVILKPNNCQPQANGPKLLVDCMSQ